MSTFFGTNGANTITGTAGNDTIQGGPAPTPATDFGNDSLVGAEGDDEIFGHGGNDRISGGPGYDSLYGGAGADSIDAGSDGVAYGEAGNDTLAGSGSAAGLLYLYGGADNDRLTILGSFGAVANGEDGADTVIGGAGNDTALGGIGDDSLNGGGGNDFVGDANSNWAWDPTSVGIDTLSGDAGDDTLLSTGGGDSLNGGAGNDVAWIDFSVMPGAVSFAPVAVGTTASFGAGNGSVVNVETFWIRGTALNDTIGGLGDNDTLEGLDGNDQMFGGSGEDSLSAGVGDDTILGGDGYDQASGSIGADSIDVGADGVGWGDGGNDTLTGSATFNGYLSLSGGDGSDKIILSGTVGGYAYGDADADTLSGSDGNDTLGGGTGADSLSGGLGNDLIADDDVSWWSWGAVVPTADGADTLLGGGGDDSLRSAGGADSIDGGTGADTARIDRSAAINAVLFNPTAVATVTSLGIGNGTLVNVETFEIRGHATLGDTMRGLDGNDVLTGEGGADSLLGGNGDDQIEGGTENDTLVGGAGFDQIFGGAGADTIDVGADGYGYGDSGNDTVTGSLSNGGYAYLYGGAGDDRLSLTGTVGGSASGDEDSDTVSGASGNDTLLGGAGADSLNGGGGNDLMSDDTGVYFTWPEPSSASASGDDTLLGGAGNDTIQSTGGADSIDGGGAIDVVNINRTLSANAVVFIPTATNITTSLGVGNGTVVNVETFGITGTAFADTLVGLANDDTLYGGGGADSIAGGAGYDEMLGGDGNDSIDAGVDGVANGDAGHDTLTGSASFVGYLNLSGGAGNDLILATGTNGAYFLGEADNDTLVGTSAGDYLDGGGGADSLVGSGGADQLIGLEGSDVLDGGAGDDTLQGGGGNDTYVVDSANDVTDETGGSGADLVLSSVTRTLGAGLEHLTLTGAATISGTGNGIANQLTGNGANNRLSGLAGADSIDGGGGNDSLDGGADNDLLIGGAGADSLIGGTGVDTAIFDGTFAEYAITFDAVTGRYSLTRAGVTDIMANDVERVQFGQGADAVVVDLRPAPDGTGAQTIVTGQAPTITSVVEAGLDEDSNAATIQVAENSAGGVAVATVTAGDANLPAGDVLAFSLVNADGTPDVTSPFSIVKTGAQTAEIRVAGGLDFEAASSYGLRVRVTDGHGNVVSQDVTVALLNVNEAPAAVTTALSVNENVQSVGTVLAADPDSSASITYSLVNAALDNALFSIDATTGALSFVAAGGANYEAGSTYTVRVRVSDAVNPGLSTVSDITVTLQDVNEAPVVTTTALSVNENVQSVGTVLATDQDASASIVYSLVSGAVNNALFSIDATTGALSFVAAGGANFEAGSAYTVRVRVSDADNPALSTVSDVTVTVQNVNEAPAITTTSLTVNENLQSVGTVVATDQDAVPSIAFSLVDGALDNALFTINASTGALSFVSAAGGDYETKASYTIRVRASDASNPALGTERDVTILLNDVVEGAVPTEGADLLSGGIGAETITALGGNDTILGSAGADRLDGSTGTDTVRFTSATLLNLATPAASTGDAAGDTYVSIERYEGAATADTMVGGTGTEWFDGREGDDRIDGGSGNDTLTGGAGADSVVGGAGNDSMLGGTGNDTLTGGTGGDTVVGGLGNDNITTTNDGVRDVFVWRSATEGSDRLAGFVSGQDQVQISRGGFGLEEDFVLTASTFVVGTAPVATGSEPIFLLNTTTGQLTYDANGAEAGGAYLIVRFTGGLPVLSDFVLVA